MAIPKVCGMETEYGIVRSDGGASPTSSSSLLINAYVSAISRKVGWDFENENPANDARGFDVGDSYAPEIEVHLVNTVLPNGARYYVDHAHPEISIPEVTNALEAVRWDRAAEEIIRASMRYAAEVLDGPEIIVHKNNSDGKGNSYGCHENYLVDRATPFVRLARQITPHFVTRMVFAGAGKVGCEEPEREDIHFEVTQRADFFEEEIGLETTMRRPIVNTRDEPHADASKYRRLHVIVGDANMSEVATYLKVGTTAIVLAMIEDDRLGDDLTLANPVGAFHHLSHDPSLRATVLTTTGRRMTGIEVQWELLAAARRYATDFGLDPVGAEVGDDVLDRWERVLTQLEHDPDSAASVVDWVAKRRLVEGYRDRHGLAPDAPRLKAIDLQYHDLRPSRGLAARAGLETLVDEDDVRTAMTEPPATTRAYFRGRVLSKFPDQVVSANWDSMVIDVGGDPLRRVPMMEPLRGTAEHVAKLIDESATTAELIDRLGGAPRRA